MSIFPSQKQSLKAKLAIDQTTKKHWGHNCVDYLIDNSGIDAQHEEVLKLKRLVEGEHDEMDYDYILNPLNTTIDKYKRFGARLRVLNILAPVKDLYLGEFGKRFKNIQVLETNTGDDNLYKEGLNLIVKNYYTQKAINELNSLGINTGLDSKEQPPLKGVIQEYERDFNKNRVITGQETLDFIKYDKELDDKYQDIYEEWVVTGKAISYKGVSFNDVDFEHVKAEQFACPMNDNVTFIEDKAWAVRRQNLPPHAILDKFHDVIDDETVDFLDKRLTNDGIEGVASGNTVFMATEYVSAGQKPSNNHLFVQNQGGIDLYHVVWRSWQKVGILTYIDGFGQVQEIKVDETYSRDKENGDISVEWNWISEVWEGYRIEETDHYFNIRPLPYNRMALNNESLQKLPYNGRMLNTVSGAIKSIIKTGEPYQALYNIVSYQREKVINKNKDKIAVIPQGLIPKGKNGWDEEKFMYYSHANSWMIVDDAAPGFANAIQGLKVLDMGLANYIRDMGALLQEIKSDWWEAIGMNRQRYGETNSSDGKGVTEQAIFRSAIISEELNRKFEKYQEKDYAGLLDLSKLAYINGKKGKYINSEQKEAFLAINPDDAVSRMESEFNVFVRNSSEENDKLTSLKEYAFAYAQNGGKSAMFMEMLDTTNFTKGKEVIGKMERLEQERIDAMEERKNEVAMQVEESRAASEQAKLDTEIYKADKEYDKAIDVELLKQGGEGEVETQSDDTPVEDMETTRMNNHKIRVDNEKIKLDKEEQKRKEKETNARVKSLATNSNSK